MKIAVIGATGFVGSRILAEALERGHETTTIVRNPGKLPSHPKVVARRGDVLEQKGLAALVAAHDTVISAYNPGLPDGDRGIRAIIDAVERAAGRLFSDRRARPECCTLMGGALPRREPWRGRGAAGLADRRGLSHASGASGARGPNGDSAGATGAGSRRAAT